MGRKHFSGRCDLGKAKLHAQFYSRNLQQSEESLFWVPRGCSKHQALLGFMTQNCSLPLQDLEDMWFLDSSLFLPFVSKPLSHNPLCLYQVLEGILSLEDLV